MKTLKLALIATILSFAMISYAGIDPQKPPVSKNLIKISLTQAVKVPGLASVMLHQLNISLLKAEPNGNFSGKVRVHSTYYKIYGTRASWGSFFRTKSDQAVGRNWLK